MKGDNRISQSLATLSDMFRYALAPNNFTCTVGDEIRQARTYATLLKLRYEDTFHLTLDIDEMLYGNITLRFLLQPVIENALYHGIKPKDKKGEVIITAMKRGNNLIIRVRDNGVGMEEEQVAAMNQSFRANLDEMLRETNQILVPNKPVQGKVAQTVVASGYSKKHGIGLKNINMRLKLIFGKAYGLQIFSQKGKGCIVEITQPFIQS